MAQAHGLVEDAHVRVHVEAEANRLSDKGSYGTRDGTELVLDLYEAAFLAEQGRLEARDRQGGAPLPVSALVARGASLVEGFETRFLVYREFRARGYVCKLTPDGEMDAWERGAGPPGSKPSTLVAPRSEAAPATPEALHTLAGRAGSLGRELLLAVVDEEADVTYYELAPATITGHVEDAGAAVAPRTRALLLRERALVLDDPGLAGAGYGNEVGGETYLSLAEAHHLTASGLQLTAADDEGTADRLGPHEVLEHARLVHADAPEAFAAYAWLRQRGLVPRTGLKFGVHYRVYQGEPGASHAPFLVQALADRAPWTFRDLARFVRLAHSVRKKAVVHSSGGGLMVQWTRP